MDLSWKLIMVSDWRSVVSVEEGLRRSDWKLVCTVPQEVSIMWKKLQTSLFVCLTLWQQQLVWADAGDLVYSCLAEDIIIQPLPAQDIWKEGWGYCFSHSFISAACCQGSNDEYCIYIHRAQWKDHEIIKGSLGGHHRTQYQKRENTTYRSQLIQIYFEDKT